MSEKCSTQTTPMIVYAIAPIDFWDGWHLVDGYQGYCDDHPDSGLTKTDVDKFLEQAQRIAKDQLHWEGDIREGPFWCPMPNRQGDYWPVFMVAWKQDNNGATFVASPFEISQFADAEAARAR